MWLLYLQFEENGRVKTYHVTARNKLAVTQLYQMAEQHGLSPQARLVEYAIFYTRGTIKAKAAPNFHFYNQEEFTERWQKVANSVL